MTSEIKVQSLSQFTNNNEAKIYYKAKQLFDSACALSNKKRFINGDI